VAYFLKACPHCRRKVRLSPLSRRFLRQSHFSATVWTGQGLKLEATVLYRPEAYMYCTKVYMTKVPRKKVLFVNSDEFWYPFTKRLQLGDFVPITWRVNDPYPILPDPPLPPKLRRVHATLYSRRLMACPHCRRKVRLSQKWECLTFVRQSHFCETVSLFCDSVDRP